MKRELKQVGKNAYACIVEMVEALSAEADSPEYEKAQQTIQEDALSVEVRSGWYSPGRMLDDGIPEEYCLLLATGGPAVRIVGQLNNYAEPTSARLEVQDWGTPWTEYAQADEQTLLRYAECFYYGG